MRIAILSRNRALYSTRRLVQAVQSRGHEPLVVDTLRLAAELRARPARLPNLPPVQAMIPRIGASITLPGLAVVRQFEQAGVATTATAAAIADSRDKRRSLQLMAQAGLPIPRTVFVTRPDEMKSALQAVGGLPVIIKPNRGTQGRGVILTDSLPLIHSLLNILRPFNEPLLLQEYVAEASGKDTRILVVGNHCVAAMERSAAPGNFRANLHQGGTAAPVRLNDQTEQLALKAAFTLRLGVGGVDILQSARGPLLLEVNSSPGLEGIERTTGVDVAGNIVQYLEQQNPSLRS
jgi:ribosomal protein S6--L-glutamate ligase